MIIQNANSVNSYLSGNGKRSPRLAIPPGHDGVHSIGI